MKALFLYLAVAFLLAGIFGINAFLDGYGDLILFLHYIIFFSILFTVLGLILSGYARLRKINRSVFNNFFLLCSLLVSFQAFVVMFCVINSLKLETGILFWFSITAFIVSVLLFVLLSGLCRKRQRYFLASLFAVLIAAPWLIISIKEGSYFGNFQNLNQNKPNVLFITVESLRYDYLGCYGNDEVKTPNMDALAKKGALFDNYFIQVPYTTASLSTLMTGQYPFHHNSRVFGEKPLSKYRPFVNELCREGYEVKMDGHLFPELFPGSFKFIKRGTSPISRIYYKLAGFQYYVNDRLGDFFPFLYGQYCFGKYTSMNQTCRLLQNIRLLRRKTWFLWTHYQENCHWPYAAPPHFIKLYNTDRKFLKPVFAPRRKFVFFEEEIPETQKRRYLNGNPHLITDELLERVRVAYSAEVSCVDKQIGMVMDYLERLNLLDKTVIILSADHGELLGEADYIGHARFLKDQLIHVPLIIYSPGSNLFEGGKKIDSFVEEVDIAPTILDLCNVDGMQDIDGRSLFDLLNPKDWHKDGIYSEVSIVGENSFRACYRTDKYKILWDSSFDKLELYDLAQDPEEEKDLNESLPEVAMKMKEKLLKLTGYSSLERLKPDRDPETDENMQNLLRSLGYLQ